MIRFAAIAFGALLAACDERPMAAAAAPAGPAPRAAAASPPAAEATYHFGTAEPRTLVQFESRTSVGTLVGTSRRLRGSATIDFEAGTGRTHLVVPVESMSTGVDGPDKVLKQKDWLDAAAHPTIEFRAEKASFQKPVTWTIEGKFTMKGVTRDLPATATVRPIPDEIARKANLGAGSWVSVKTTFKVKLSDHGIKVPDTSAATVDDVWTVSVDIFGTTEKPAESGPAAVAGAGDAPRIRAKRVTLDEGVPGKRYAFGRIPQHATIAAQSTTDLETVVASTKSIGGQLAVELEKGAGKVKLSVPVKSLKTGIDKRDEHLQSEAWMDAAKFPDIDFESTKAAKKDATTWMIDGNLTIHGVTRPVTVEVRMRQITAEMMQKARWGETEGLGFATSFKVKLSDYGIKVPEIAVAKVSDEWSLSLDLIAAAVE